MFTLKYLRIMTTRRVIQTPYNSSCIYWPSESTICFMKNGIHSTTGRNVKTTRCTVIRDVLSNHSKLEFSGNNLKGCISWMFLSTYELVLLTFSHFTLLQLRVLQILKFWFLAGSGLFPVELPYYFHSIGGFFIRMYVHYNGHSIQIQKARKY